MEGQILAPPIFDDSLEDVDVEDFAAPHHDRKGRNLWSLSNFMPKMPSFHMGSTADEIKHFFVNMAYSRFKNDDNDSTCAPINDA